MHRSMVARLCRRSYGRIWLLWQFAAEGDGSKMRPVVAMAILGASLIGVSGLGSETVLAKAGKDCVQTFLRKPYATSSLLVVLREVLNGEN